MRKYSTTQLLTEEKPKLTSQPGDIFKSILLQSENRKSFKEGGLRTKGYYKKSFTSKPLISIITVVYNHNEYLSRTIESVIHQSYDNIEYIIIDGGSTDNTINTIMKYHNVIDYFITEQDFGIYDAMNKALRLSLGEYYLVLGADDYLYENAISEIVNRHLQNNSPDFVVASVDVGEKLFSGYYPAKGWIGANAVVTTHSVGMVIRLSLHKELGLYSLNFPQIADSLFIKKLISAQKIGISSDVIAGRFSVDGVSNNNVARGLCEGFLIQLETEKSVLLQLIIFIIRLFKNIFRLKK